METNEKTSRREFFRAGAGLVALSGLVPAAGLAVPRAAEKEPDILPTEDLMQEHELLNRILLIYDEGRSRLERNRPFDPATLKRSASIVQKFVEDYHEKNEEDYLFPRFEKAGKLLDLVPVLRKQHAAGRKLTQAILTLSDKAAPTKPGAASQLARALDAFVRMYRPHESREGSVLFPAFRTLIPEKELREMGEMFEKKEHELLGPEGYEGMVVEVAKIEKELGIYDLDQFTPHP